LTISRVVCDKCVLRVVPVHVEGVHLYFTNLRMYTWRAFTRGVHLHVGD
jgi:hypothetical protein